MMGYCDMCEYSDYKGILFCKYCFKNRKIDPFLAEINQINDKVYLGNEEGAADLKKLKEIGITHVLVCGVDLIKFHPKDFVYYQVLIEDTPETDIIKHFNKSFKFIQSAKKVYVHCWAGVSRSASFVIAYLMWSKKLEFEVAYNEVKSKRDCIGPNDGFMQQLKKYDEQIKTKNNLNLFHL